ncbi:MAG: thermonuclease family protein, partial [Dehalococcoidia bacterium]
DTDRYGRLVARVYVGTNDVNLELVRAGFAWHYRQYSDDPRAEQPAGFFAIGCLASVKLSAGRSSGSRLSARQS